MQFRKKPVVIDAIQIPHDSDIAPDGMPRWLIDAFAVGTVTLCDGYAVAIKTLEGTMRGEPGDWIIQGVVGEIYPCKDSIFKATYDPA